MRLLLLMGLILFSVVSSAYAQIPCPPNLSQEECATLQDPEFHAFVFAKTACQSIGKPDDELCLREHGYPRLSKTPTTVPASPNSTGAKMSAFMAVALSGALGLLLSVGLFRLMGDAVAGNLPKATGLKWARWIVVLTSFRVCNDIFAPLISGVPYKQELSFILFMDVIGFGAWALFAFVAGYMWAKFRGRIDESAKHSYQGFIPSETFERNQPDESAKPCKSEDALFAIVAKEMMHNQRDEGLWTKAFALEDGDDKKTKAHYIRLRVEALKNA